MVRNPRPCLLRGFF